MRSYSQKRPNLSSLAVAVPSAGTRSRPLTPLHLTLFLHVNLGRCKPRWTRRKRTCSQHRILWRQLHWLVSPSFSVAPVNWPIPSLETYGASVTQLKAPIGGTIPFDTLAAVLQDKQYKVLTFTHVDTSTGVLSDATRIAETVRRVSPDTLVVMDAVCSVASEEIKFDEWDLDVVLTASQKGLGAPPGLSVLLASPRAIAVWEKRKSKGVRDGSYYASWSKWAFSFSDTSRRHFSIVYVAIDAELTPFPLQMAANNESVRIWLSGVFRNTTRQPHLRIPRLPISYHCQAIRIAWSCNSCVFFSYFCLLFWPQTVSPPICKWTLRPPPHRLTAHQVRCERTGTQTGPAARCGGCERNDGAVLPRGRVRWRSPSPTWSEGCRGSWGAIK